MKNFKRASRVYRGRRGGLTSRAAVVALALASLSAPAASEPAALATQRLQARNATPNEVANGTMSPAARAAMERGPLPMSEAAVAAKAAANRVRDAAEKAAPNPLAPTESPLPGASLGGGPRVPAVVSGLNFAGQAGASFAQPDPTGAIGPMSYIQLTNDSAGIFNRTTGAPLSLGALNQLANVSTGVTSYNPQIIWDATTNRFYYAMVSVFSFIAHDYRLSFGWSKTNNPGDVTSQWCHYVLPLGTRLPDFPKLGDSVFFMIIGINSFPFSSSFGGADLIAIAKPARGTACPDAADLKIGKTEDLRDAAGVRVFAPLPSNQIDNSFTGYVVGQNAFRSSFQFFNVTRNATTGLPVFGAARNLTVPAWNLPPDAIQPDFPSIIPTPRTVAAPKLETLDGRPTQAVQAIDPRLGTLSFWTQHTIANGATSKVRWYEINPVPPVPVIQRTGDIAPLNGFAFNAAISPDRRVDGFTRAFGNNFVIQYNLSSGLISPRIVAGSSLDGAPLTFATVKVGVGPYRNFNCRTATQVCRWGFYSSATPDPRPTTAGSGQVWGTNQFSGLVNPPPNGANWRTQIFSLRP